MSTRSSTRWLVLSGIVLVAAVLVAWAFMRPPNGAPQTVLRVWQTETDQKAIEELKKTVGLFEKQHPGVQVQLESVAWGSLSAKLSVAMQAHNEPDLTHLEPFMVYSLVYRDLLAPIDDVIRDIEADNGDEIFPSVKDLQLYHKERYGIAYAVGTTAFAYRKDWADRLQLKVPTNWSEYIEFARRLSEGTNGEAKVLLPGGDPFFIDQLFAELLANNGGRLFDPTTYRPLLTDKKVVETLCFFKELSPYVEKDWQTQPYLDQFHRFARGEAGNVPVTYARAFRAIDNMKDFESYPMNKGSTKGPECFALMSQPVGYSYSGPSIATIDCEPFAIFKSAARKKAGVYGTNADLAKEFLRLFYQKDRYLPFVTKVPIHLTPIFRKMAAGQEYNSSITTWKPWADQTVVFLSDTARVRPILMPDVSPEGRKLPFLLEFQASRILTNAVTDVVAKGHSPEEAAANAQLRAERLLESLGFKKW